MEISRNLVNSGTRFLLDLQNDLGTEKGLEVWDKLREAMGDEIAGQVLFGILQGHTGNSICLEAVADGRVIEAIKLVREFTGMGLKDAKDLVERVRYNAGHVETMIGRDQDYNGHPIIHDISAMIRRFEAVGCKVR
jgi:hypothetical protein